MAQQDQVKRLAESNDMEPIAGTVDVEIPAKVLWQSFQQGYLWPRWNRCFFWVKNRRLELGRQLVWIFEPIRWFYPYKMFAIAKIVELEEGKKVTWEVTALPGFYARHTYHVEDLGEGKSRFGSWEKATGWGFRLMKKFWLAHFTFVKDRSLEGARSLETLYRNAGNLDRQAIPRRRYLGFWLGVVVAVALLAVVAWFFASYVRQTTAELAPGIHVVFGGGSNSLVIAGNDETFVVDPKFPPSSRTLKRWIEDNVDAPVRSLVNTHYHYDHTRGNAHYQDVAIYAFANVPGFMQADDPDYWRENPHGLPNELVSGPVTLNVGPYDLVLTHPGPGHTQGDLWLRIPQQNLIATGDLVFHTYYPFMDLEAGRGIDIPAMIQTIRHLAETYPDATFVPGHGPLATAADLTRYADYLQFLWDEVGKAIDAGHSERDAIRAIDLGDWDLKILPSLHSLIPEWATASQNIRWAYRLRSRADGAREPDSP